MRCPIFGRLALCAGLFSSGCAGLPAALGPQVRLLDGRSHSGFFALDGVYVSGRFHLSHLGGDFDGGTTLLGNASVPDDIFVPDAGSGIGREFAVGFHQRGAAFEVAFTKIEFDESTYRNVALNGLRYFRANSELQTYVLGGILAPWIDLDDASQSGPLVGDAELRSGFGANLGVGVAWFLSPEWMFDLRGLATWQSFGSARGVSGVEADLTSDLRGWQFGVSAGLTWILTGGRR